ELLAAKCCITAAIADHVDSFTNECGELLLCHQRPGERTGTLYHSDMDWEPNLVEDDAITFDKRLVRGHHCRWLDYQCRGGGRVGQMLLTTSGTRSRRR